MTKYFTMFFEPLDVLLFRDPRPLDPGVSIVAHSVFPGPGVFYGCIRAALLRACGAKGSPFATSEDRQEFYLDSHVNLARSFLGGPSRLGSMQIRGPLLAAHAGSQKVMPYFPAPRDLVFGKEEVALLRAVPFENLPDAPRRLRHGPQRLQEITSPLPFSPEEPEKSAPTRYFNASGMRKYLKMRNDKPESFKPKDDFVFEEDAFKREPRVGIARDPQTRAAAEGMLYFTQPFRFAPTFGFAVDIAVDNASRGLVEALQGQVVPLGGKGHRARIHVLEGALIPADIDAAEPTTKKDKLVFVTPLPLPLASDAAVQNVVTGRALPVGGYDLAKRAPKGLQRALPTGTIVYIKPGTPAAYDSLFVRDDAATTMERRMGYGTALGGA